MPSWKLVGCTLITFEARPFLELIAQNHWRLHYAVRTASVDSVRLQSVGWRFGARGVFVLDVNLFPVQLIPSGKLTELSRYACVAALGWMWNCIAANLSAEQWRNLQWQDQWNEHKTSVRGANKSKNTDKKGQCYFSQRGTSQGKIRIIKVTRLFSVLGQER